MLLHDACFSRCTAEAVSELWLLRRRHSISASRGTAVKRSLNDWKVESSSLVQVLIFILILAVPGHALLWLTLVKWKRNKKESTSFEYV